MVSTATSSGATADTSNHLSRLVALVSQPHLTWHCRAVLLLTACMFVHCAVVLVSHAQCMEKLDTAGDLLIAKINETRKREEEKWKKEMEVSRSARVRHSRMHYCSSCASLVYSLSHPNPLLSSPVIVSMNSNYLAEAPLVNPW